MKRKIVFLWIGRLGDLAVSLRFISGFRKRYPDDEIIFIGSNKNIELAILSGVFDKVYQYPLKITPLAICEIILFYFKHILFKNYFMIIDLNPSPSNSSYFIMKFANAKHKVSFVKNKKVCHTQGIEVEELMPMRQKYRKMAKELGVEYDENYHISVDKMDMRSKLSIANDYPIIGIFAGNFSKIGHRWPAEKFIRLTNIIIEKLPKLNIVYITDPYEFKILKAKILSHLPTKYVISNNIKELCMIINSINLLLTNNTGPLHIADLISTPTLSINTCYSATCWLPESKIHFYVKSSNWRTCHDIEIEEVFEKLIFALNGLKLRYE